MKITTVDLYEYFNLTRPEHGVGYLTCYINENSPEFCTDRAHPAMIVIPGGGYSGRSDREKEQVAMQYYANDYNVFTLAYAVAPAKHPTMLIEACMAVAYVRENAKALFVKPNNIACVGFSAGGHLCGSVGTLFNAPEVVDALKEKASLTRPDAILLGYPVISKCIDKTHEGTFTNLCGDDLELKKRLSIEKCVTKDSAPAFIFHTANDGAVPVRNSIVLADAYIDAGVPFSLHVFEKGQHGLSLGTQAVYTKEQFSNMAISPEFKKWVELSLSWLAEHGFGVETI